MRGRLVGLSWGAKLVAVVLWFGNRVCRASTELRGDKADASFRNRAHPIVLDQRKRNPAAFAFAESVADVSGAGDGHADLLRLRFEERKKNL